MLFDRDTYNTPNPVEHGTHGHCHLGWPKLGPLLQNRPMANVTRTASSATPTHAGAGYVSCKPRTPLKLLDLECIMAFFFLYVGTFLFQIIRPADIFTLSTHTSISATVISQDTDAAPSCTRA